MESLIPPHKFPYKEDSFENSPATILITIDNALPSRQLSLTSIPLPPSLITLEPMDTYECFRLAKNRLHKNWKKKLGSKMISLRVYWEICECSRLTRYYNQLSPRQDKKNKDWHDTLDLHHPYALLLWQICPLFDLTILSQIQHYQHLLEGQFLHYLMLGDQADLLSSLMMTQPHCLQMHRHQNHGHQNHHQKREKDHPFVDQWVAM